ncbi:MAG: hypothetical protein KY433_08440, partial [Actinobacteria bacterium]|nr:hypothetical protein [Actinomycetota bacterium]
MATIAIPDSRPEGHPTTSCGPAGTVAPTGPRADVVRVFGADPDLLAGLDATTAELLRRRVVAPKLWLAPGEWQPPSPARDSLGLLVIDGLITRTVELHGRRCPELVGAGD